MKLRTDRECLIIPAIFAWMIVRPLWIAGKRIFSVILRYHLAVSYMAFFILSAVAMWQSFATTFDSPRLSAVLFWVSLAALVPPVWAVIKWLDGLDQVVVRDTSN